ncbi:MAG: tyrosine-type recombinase/integrase [Coriobacteriia bacterium]|nr:tyrosine-type recombinase/integrase [Coriobacteriia bacterium]
MPIKRNNRWGARVYDPGTGRQIWLGSYDRKRDAEIREREAKRDLDLGQFTQPKRIGFADFVERWFASLTVRESSVADYRNTCRHLTAHFKNRPLHSIGAEEIDAFLADFGKSHAPATVRKTATRLRQIFKRAVSWGYLTASPATELSNIPRIPKQTAQRIIGPDQVNRLLAAVPSYWRPLFLVAVMTGLRRGELFGLTWNDVLWAERQIRVRHQLQTGRLVEPKSDSAKRRIDIGPLVLESLTDHKRTCPSTELDLLFPTPSGRPIHPSDWNRDVFRPATRRAMLPDLTLHDLRHTYASALIHQGQSVKYVQTVMGHASAQTTLDVYGHLFEIGGQDAARQLEGWLAARPAIQYGSPLGARSEELTVAIR